jgi:hypothetical protein
MFARQLLKLTLRHKLHFIPTSNVNLAYVKRPVVVARSEKPYSYKRTPVEPTRREPHPWEGPAKNIAIENSSNRTNRLTSSKPGRFRRRHM